MALAEGRAGINIGTDGTVHEVTLERTGAQRTADAHGRYFDSNSRGNVFCVATAIAGVTLAAANASPLAAGTGQPVVGLFNPTSSGKNAVVLAILVEHVSGTPAAGAWSWNVGAAPQPVTQAGTAPTSLLTGKTTGSAMVGLVNQATTGSTAAAHVLAVPFGVFAGAIAATSVGLMEQYEPAGLLIVPPGAYAGLAVPGAGTSHVVAASLVWEEVPV